MEVESMKSLQSFTHWKLVRRTPLSLWIIVSLAQFCKQLGRDLTLADTTKMIEVLSAPNPGFRW